MSKRILGIDRLGWGDGYRILRKVSRRENILIALKNGIEGESLPNSKTVNVLSAVRDICGVRPRVLRWVCWDSW